MRAPSRGRSPARRFRFALAFILVVAPAAALAESGPSPATGRSVASATAPPVAGAWRLLPAAPIVVGEGLNSVWTGRQMLVFGRLTSRSEGGAIPKPVDVAAAYDPGANSWHRLAPLPGPSGYYPEHIRAVWTGKEMLVWGPVNEAFNPLTNQWRRLSRAPADAYGYSGLVVWTGREMIGWGGGCCGDAFNGGVAYNPATNTWRKLARSPLAGSQNPIGAWTGREFAIFVGGLDPDGKPWPARLARAAAYNPATDRWRRIAPLPAPRTEANAVWDEREVLVVGGWGAPRGGHPPATAAVGFAYNPATNRWRRLPRMESGRIGAAAVWTGKRLLVWGGQTAVTGSTAPSLPAHGLAYDPKANRWSPLAPAPIYGRADPTAVWTGQAMIVWGGGYSYPPFADGAVFRPTTP